MAVNTNVMLRPSLPGSFKDHSDGLFAIRVKFLTPFACRNSNPLRRRLPSCRRCVCQAADRAPAATARAGTQARDRKSVVEGKSVPVRVDPGGGRRLNKKKK